jgi:hypothetical protein
MSAIAGGQSILRFPQRRADRGTSSHSERSEESGRSGGARIAWRTTRPPSFLATLLMTCMQVRRPLTRPSATLSPLRGARGNLHVECELFPFSPRAGCTSRRHRGHKPGTARTVFDSVDGIVSRAVTGAVGGVWETPGSSAFSKSCGKARGLLRGFPQLGTFHSPVYFSSSGGRRFMTRRASVSR